MNFKKIESILNEICPNFRGIVEVGNYSKNLRSGSYIIYIPNSNSSNGHYTALIIFSTNDKYFFDSYGHSPFDYGINNRIKHNKRVLQAADSCTCGLYCIYFLYFAYKEGIGKTLDRFSDSIKVNESMVLNFASSIASIDRKSFVKCMQK